MIEFNFRYVKKTFGYKLMDKFFRKPIFMLVICKTAKNHFRLGFLWFFRP
jgi:hypothetical protein